LGKRVQAEDNWDGAGVLTPDLAASCGARPSRRRVQVDPDRYETLFGRSSADVTGRLQVGVAERELPPNW